jgi:hypothetical protein
MDTGGVLIKHILRPGVAALVTVTLIPSSSFAQPLSEAEQLLLYSNLLPSLNIRPTYPIVRDATQPATEVTLNSFVRQSNACGRSSIQLAQGLGTVIQRTGNVITVKNAFSIEPLDFLGTCSTMMALSLGTLAFSPGKYTVRALPFGGPYSESEQVQEPQRRTQELSFAVLTQAQAQKGLVEIPAQDSVQSGVGLISGWSCVADAVEISIDGGARIKVPSESPRGDVESVCSHPNAGFGLLMNYNTLSEGEHTVQLYVKGVAIGDLRKFKVVKPKGEFARGLVKQITVADFPETGKSTTLDWREGEQRFGIKEVK